LVEKTFPKFGLKTKFWEKERERQGKQKGKGKTREREENSKRRILVFY
jgi:hypothetical protein